MTAPATQLAHLVFFEALADGCIQATSDEIIAGLATLRMFDDWVGAGAAGDAPNPSSPIALRDVVSALSLPTTARSLLIDVVDIVERLERVDPEPALPVLYAYAQWLQSKSAFALAADVYGTVIGFANQETDDDLIADSRLRHAYSLRMNGEHDRALRAYSVARRSAAWRGDTARILRADLGEANVSLLRGNLPEADQLMEIIVERSRSSGDSALEASALQDQAVVAQRRGDPTRSISLNYRALSLATEPLQKQRIIGNIGAYFLAMGCFDAARDALLVQEATTSYDETRVIAQINLLALAARTSDRAEFDRYRERLANTFIPVERVTDYLIETGRGFLTFGESAIAHGYLQRAREEAVRHGFNRAIFEADRLLGGGTIMSPNAGDREPASAPVSIAHIQLAMREMAIALDLQT